MGDVIQRRPYVSQQSLIDALQPKGRRDYWKSEYLPKLGSEVLLKATEHAGRMPSPHSLIFVFPLDGALNRLPYDYSPMGNRDARAVFDVMASWESVGDDKTNIDWARAAWEDMRSLSTGGAYINFMTEEEGDDRIRAAYGANYERIVDVKTRWDPRNQFRINKNIVPRATP